MLQMEQTSRPRGRVPTTLLDDCRPWGSWQLKPWGHYLDVFFEPSPFWASPVSGAAGRRRRSCHVPRGLPSRKPALVPLVEEWERRGPEERRGPGAKGRRDQSERKKEKPGCLAKTNFRKLGTWTETWQNLAIFNLAGGGALPRRRRRAIRTQAPVATLVTWRV